MVNSSRALVPRRKDNMALRLTPREERLVNALLEVQDWDWAEGQYTGSAGYPASVVAAALKDTGLSVRPASTASVRRTWGSHGAADE